MQADFLVTARGRVASYVSGEHGAYLPIAHGRVPERPRSIVHLNLFLWRWPGEPLDWSGVPSRTVFMVSRQAGNLECRVASLGHALSVPGRKLISNTP